MQPIRALYCSNAEELGSKLDELKAQARDVRAEPGCLEFDFFRDIEFSDNFVQMELWESQAAFDAHWKRWLQRGVFCDVSLLSAPFHLGAPRSPRRHGLNAAEFYHYQRFQPGDGFVIPLDASDLIESIRWPSHAGHRIILQNATDPAQDSDFLPYCADTRTHKGCLEFSYYRSIEFPENNLLFELWDAPPAIYDEHYYVRTLQKLYPTGVPQPPWPRVERRYGTNGSEHYDHCMFTLIGDVWQPEDPAERSASVRWP